MNPIGFWWGLWKRRNEPPAQRDAANVTGLLVNFGGGTVLKNTLKGVQWVNFLTLLAQLLNSASNAFPNLQTSPWVLAIQGIIAAILPSVGGVGHAIVFGTPQDPTAAPKS